MNKPSMKPMVVLAAVLASSCGLLDGASEPAFRIATSRVTRGDIVRVASATGVFEPRETVQVGAQVSGTIAELLVDHNAIVQRDQLLARLDPSSVQAQIAQARASLARAEADLDRELVREREAANALKRAAELSARSLLPLAELETVRLAARTASARVRSARAAVDQATAVFRMREVDLQHTIIRSPIDGLVLSRNVEVGQTVAARMEAPVLYVLAQDLGWMQAIVNINEDDIGEVRRGLQARISVDAYPDEIFEGVVEQVRLQPVVNRGVVRYPTVIEAQNQDLKLTPGMTARVDIEIARRSRVLRVPNLALRFTPTDEMLASLEQDASSFDAADDESWCGDCVWKLEGGKLTPVDVELGLSDGAHVELLGGSLAEGDELVWNMSSTTQAVRPPPPPRNRGRFPFGPRRR
jgi:HlyD family secretion protein